MKQRLLALLMLSLFMLAGCSKVPTEQEKNAFDALDLAREAEANVYAPQAYATAQDTLDGAVKERERQDDRFKLFRSYGDATQQFLRAETLANEALSLAATEKANLADSCRQLVQQAARAVDSCAILLDQAPGGKGARADLRMLREDLSTLAEELGGASDDLEQLNFASSSLKAEAVIAKATALREQIIAAIEKKK